MCRTDEFEFDRVTVVVGRSALKCRSRTQPRSLLQCFAALTATIVFLSLVFLSLADVARAETPPDQEAAIKAIQGYASNIQKNRDGTVRFVRFSRPHVTDEHVAQVRAFQQLDYLAVVAPQITDAGLSHIGELTSLDTLFLSDSGATDATLPQLSGLSKLERLYLDRTAVTDDGLQHIAALPLLNTLSLQQTAITDAGLRHLSGLSTLDALYLSDTNVSDTGLESLTRLSLLRVLSLNRTRLTAAGLSHLSSLEKLETLELSGLNFTLEADGVDDSQTLADLQLLPALKLILLGDSRIDPAAIENLNAARRMSGLNAVAVQVAPDDASRHNAFQKFLAGEPLAGVDTVRAAVAPDSKAETASESLNANRSRDSIQQQTASTAAAEAAATAAAGYLAADHVPDFQRHVIPLLGRLGCNGRTCHGSFQGQGGFRLSMFGYDFDADLEALTGGETPRIDRDHSTNSLILRKPVSDDDHGGGKRFEQDGPEFQILKRWIEHGASGVDGLPRSLVRFEVRPAVESRGSLPEPAQRPGDSSLQGSAPTDIDSPKTSAERNGFEFHTDASGNTLQFRTAGQSVALQCIAHWSDGLIEDVTGLTRFQSNDDAVATVSKSGVVTSTGSGATDVIAFYDNGITSTSVLMPISDQVGGQFPDVPAPTPIDRFVVERLSRLGIVPSELCTDEEFLRRVTLDLIGSLPTPEQVTNFVTDQSPDKRERWIDGLLRTPAYSEWWSMWMADLTASNSQYLGTTDMNSPAAAQWNAWLRRRVEDNAGWDEIVAGLILAQSRRPDQTYEDYVAEQSRYLRTSEPDDFTDPSNPMHYYWFRSNNQLPADRALAFGYTFLGVRLQCAQCHKHPFDQWSQQDFEQFTQFFTRIKAGIAPDAFESQQQLKTKLGVPLKLNTAALRRQMYLRVSAEGLPIPWNEIWIEQPGDQPQIARLLGGPDFDLNQFSDPREPLMAWLLDENNPWFAASFVNRMWARFFGVGIVEPPDDFNRANPPSNKPLLDWLSREFIAHGYDMRWLHRTITTSRTYQLSWRPTESNRADERNFSHAQIRRLPAEVTIDAILQATATDARNASWSSDLTDRRIGQHPKSIQSRGIDYSLLVFGKPLRTTNCDCERQQQPTLLQSLYVRNDTEMLGWLERSDGWCQQVANERGETLSPETTDAGSRSRQGFGPVSGSRSREDSVPADESPLTAEQRDDIIRTAWLRTLSRLPTDPELNRARQHFSSINGTAESLRDILWALLNTQEFLTNH